MFIIFPEIGNYEYKLIQKVVMKVLLRDYKALSVRMTN